MPFQSDLLIFMLKNRNINVEKKKLITLLDHDVDSGDDIESYLRNEFKNLMSNNVANDLTKILMSLLTQKTERWENTVKEVNDRAKTSKYSILFIFSTIYWTLRSPTKSKCRKKISITSMTLINGLQ